MKLTALIPAYNDDYALTFCLASIADHFDEIFILDDASTDHTPDVAAGFARRYKHIRFNRHEGPQLGWVDARNRLLAMSGSDLLFWLDSDDVLCDYNASELRKIADGPHPIVRLRLCEMWGDFFHTTQRLRHYDKCHAFVNRRRFKDLLWKGRAMAKLRPGASVTPKASGQLMLFHIKGVKSDRRLVERQHMRGYLRSQSRADRLSEQIELDEGQIHQRALKMLLRSHTDRLVPTYKAGIRWPQGVPHRTAPQRPKVILDALPGRFEVIYGPDGPIDRVDHGWQACPGSKGDVR